MQEIQDSFKLSLSNPSDTKREVGLFDVAGKAEIQHAEDGKGILFSTAGGAANGLQMPSHAGVNEFAHDTVNNTYYIPIQFNGIFVYNAKTKTGSRINTGTAVTGDDLPSDNVTDIAIDEINNTIYAGTTSGVWKYDIANDTGKVYNSAGGAVSGNQLPNNFSSSVEYDSLNHFLWVAGNGSSFVWRLNLNNEEGYNASANAVGEAYNGAANAQSIIVDTANNQVIVGTTMYGLWFYDIAGNSGKVYNNVGGAANGSQLPANAVKWQMAITLDGVLYVPTYSGIWQYNIGTDTGLVINNATVFDGDLLPSNNVISCHYVAESNTMYFGLVNLVWSLNLDTNTGTKGIAHTSGDAIPVGSFVSIGYHNGVFMFATLNEGAWLFIESDITVIGINNGLDADSSGSYESILESIRTQPIAINKIIYQSENVTQQANSIKIIGSDIDGAEKSYYINILSRLDPIHPYPVIPIELEQEVIIDHKSYIIMNVEGNTEVNLIFEGRQANSASLLTNKNEILEPDVEVLEPDGSDLVSTTTSKFTLHPAVKIGLMVFGLVAAKKLLR